MTSSRSSHGCECATLLVESLFLHSLMVCAAMCERGVNGRGSHINRSLPGNPSWPWATHHRRLWPRSTIRWPSACWCRHQTQHRSVCILCSKLSVILIEMLCFFPLSWLDVLTCWIDSLSGSASHSLVIFLAIQICIVLYRIVVKSMKTV